MKEMLKIHDEDARGNRFHTIRIINDQDELTVKEIIKRRIENEICKFNLQRPICFFSLVQPEDSEITLRGFRLREHRAIDWQTQFKVAIDAFEKKHFIVNANGKDLQSLDDVISIDQDTDVVMIKFMEIVGG